MKKRIAILGSTGSIGTQALDVIRQNPDMFEVEVLTANSNADLLINQSIEFSPNAIVIANDDKYLYVKEALANYPIKVYAGADAISQVVEMKTIDLVLTAMVGYSGLIPTVRAIKAGKDIALANKETLVVAGELINELAKQKKTGIIPVDSEHSAIFQCLVGETHNEIEKIYLTASGGPFRGKTAEELAHVTKNQALKHPNWTMGAKVTIDSASLMNKGLEAIEAKWLFGVKPEQIQVVVHPQSIIHSLVQFRDGSMKAQMGLPDMKLPIQYAMAFPARIPSNFPRFDFLNYPNLTFEQPDVKVFRNLGIAFEAMNTGGTAPCIMNAANEIVVEAFLNDKISFLKMPDIIEETIQKVQIIAKPSLNDYIETDKEARIVAQSLIK
jgi:1-deoxy-D-xylulose-5-phosphate reductoisomerase